MKNHESQKGTEMYFLVDLVNGATVLARVVLRQSAQGKNGLFLISTKGGKSYFWTDDREAELEFRSELRRENITFTETDHL